MSASNLAAKPTTAQRFNPKEMLARLIAFDTTSARSNLALIDFVRDYLAAYGIESRLSFDDSKAKANLYASLGPAGPGGVVLSGHTDVVPVAGQPWQSDPFTLTARGDQPLRPRHVRHEGVHLPRALPGAGDAGGRAEAAAAYRPQL